MQVGCVIASPDFRKVIAVGYNGGASGQENDCESLEPGMCGHLHAEENACINCDVPRDTYKVVYCTVMPCKMCAKRLINLGGVMAVTFETPYRLTESVDMLKKAGIRVVRYYPNNPIETAPYDLELK
jgi:dCMP deaminase